MGLTSGIEVAEHGGAGQPIARAATAVVAFVGRTLRGPVNRPVPIGSFAEFQSVFGGLWQPSPLSYAVEQFYENGGATALIVRVVNGGRPPSLSLPGADGYLVLAALAAGTREFLRAAVDFDGCESRDGGQFNLTVQRVRAPGSEHVEDQEIYRRLSVAPDSPRYVATALLESSLVRVSGRVPAFPPGSTVRGDGYIGSSPDGDDGGPLTDYDVIGSATGGTGLFSLRQIDVFNFLCIPPLSREHAIGPGVLLVAARFCRDRRALLLVDPPASWAGPEDALRGLRELSFRSEQAVMYYPRVLAYDRLRGRFEPFAPSGAAAGMLARLDAVRPLWSPADVDEGALRPGLRPAVMIGESARTRLVTAGINVLQAVRPRVSLGARTLAGPMASAPDWKYLGLRRLALFLADSLERGTRWVVFEKSSPSLWHRLHSHVAEFLADLEADGAFAARAPGESWFVICDERINTAGAPGGSFMFGVAALREGDYHCWLVSHGPGGDRVQSVTLNRLQSAGGRLPLDPDLDVATMFGVLRH